MVNSTQLNFGIEILRWLRGQWPKLHLGLNALSNQKILKGIYYVLCTYLGLVFGKNDFETTSLSRKLVYYLGKTKIFTHFGKPDFKATNCRLYLLGVVPSGLCINCLIKVCKLLFFWKFCFSTKGQIPWDKIINQKKSFLTWWSGDASEVCLNCLWRFANLCETLSSCACRTIYLL